MHTLPRRCFTTSLVLFLSLAGLVPLGCGEPEPPPVTPESLQEAKKEREQIIKKEYGGSAPAPGKK